MKCWLKGGTGRSVQSIAHMILANLGAVALRDVQNEAQSLTRATRMACAVSAILRRIHFYSIRKYNIFKSNWGLLAVIPLRR